MTEQKQKDTTSTTQTTEAIVAETKTAPENKSAENPNTRNKFGNRNRTFGRRQTRTRVSASGFEEKVVGLKRISKTTKGGRHMRFSALVVIGDKNGRVGYGIGKSTEVPNAIRKAIKNARNQMFKITMNKRNTIYHEIIGKHGASSVLLKPAPIGTGIIAGGAIRAIVELAGFKDIYTKNLGSNTSLNMVQATLDGLLKQRHPSAIASLRDKNVGEL